MNDLFEEWDVATPEGVVDVSSLSNFELMDFWAEQKEILLSLGEVLDPKTRAGRDAHSLYAACVIEMKARGLK